MKLYLSGPITGMEQESAEVFNEAENYLAAKGYEVVNPLKLDHNHDKRWENFMAVDIIAMLGCDHICFLPGWQHSRGARLEYAIAEERGMGIFFWRKPDAAAPAECYPPGEAGHL